jgi:amino acid transporter
MILACVVNSVFLMAFIIVLLFFMGPLDAIPEGAPLPLVYVLYSATGSKQATNTLVALIAILYFVCLFNVFASVSRLIWVFAKDNGLPFSNTFAYVSLLSSVISRADNIQQVHPTLKLPVNALAFVAVIIICLSLIYIGSATAFNALISLQTFALHVSYFFPILFMLIRRLRGPPPPYGSFKLGAFGVPLNVLSLFFLVYVAMWMPFPQMLPVTKDNMNYAGPIFGAVVVGAILDWFINGRKRFQMPVIRYE